MKQKCNCQTALDFKIAMAFQPIIDSQTRSVFAYEALVRGENGEGAASVLAKVTEGNKYSFDQACRIQAIESIAKLSDHARVSINFMPNAIYNPNTCIARTLKAADNFGVKKERIIFEVIESEQPVSNEFLNEIFLAYHNQGFTTAIDDFGAGYSGLNLLVDMRPDIVKLDRHLIDGIDHQPRKSIIVRNLVIMLQEMGVTALAEGIERREEYLFLRDIGVTLMQGYYFAKPELEALPIVSNDCW